MGKTLIVVKNRCVENVAPGKMRIAVATAPRLVHIVIPRNTYVKYFQNKIPAVAHVLRWYLRRPSPETRA